MELTRIHYNQYDPIQNYIDLLPETPVLEYYFQHQVQCTNHIQTVMYSFESLIDNHKSYNSGSGLMY